VPSIRLSVSGASSSIKTMNDSNGVSALYEVLQAAASQNPELLKPAEAKLSSWETHPGFYAALLVC
jgi:hypothetical protein